MALINRLDDPAKAEASLAQLSRTVTNFLAGMMANSGMTLAMRETTDGDLKIHFVGAPLVRPAWAIKNGVLYVALYPQITELTTLGQE